MAENDNEAAARAAERQGPRRLARAAERLRRIDAAPGLMQAMRALRRRLPGDPDYGDPLSLAGSEPPQLLGQRLAAVTGERPSAMRELGLGALQLWQSLSEAQGRGRGERELAILFTDLVDFSNWALEAGDDAALELLRRVGKVAERPIEARDGRVVKRLGDGLMAVFGDAGDAVAAAVEATAAVRELELRGYRPRMRAGVHLGRPRKLGGDYFGVDVNVAARIASAAGADQVLISARVCERIKDTELRVKRRWRFKAKGAPDELKVFAVESA